jgi:hypothetical protein
MNFLNFVTAFHHRLGIDIPETDLPEACRPRMVLSLISQPGPARLISHVADPSV